MTKEEAVKEIEKAFKPAFANYIITALTEDATVSDKEPTTKNDLGDDAVRRKAVLNTLDNMDSALDDEDRTVETYKELLKECYKVLPSVTTRANKIKGHWKVVSDGYSDNAYICECSECKDTVWVYKDADRKWNYCPNCGADMR